MEALFPVGTQSWFPRNRSQVCPGMVPWGGMASASWTQPEDDPHREVAEWPFWRRGGAFVITSS